MEYPQDLFAEIFGFIEILESCKNPDFVEATPQNALPEDYYSGDVYFRMEDWYYYPDTCPITFTCEFLDGPRNDLDLCDVSNISSFDAKWGDWYFYATDMNEWPPGEYIFRITGTIGD